MEPHFDNRTLRNSSIFQINSPDLVSFRRRFSFELLPIWERDTNGRCAIEMFRDTIQASNSDCSTAIKTCFLATYSTLGTLGLRARQLFVNRSALIRNVGIGLSIRGE